MDSATWLDQVNNRKWPQLNNPRFQQRQVCPAHSRCSEGAGHGEATRPLLANERLLLDEWFVAFVAPTTSSSCIAANAFKGIAGQLRSRPK